MLVHFKKCFAFPILMFNPIDIIFPLHHVVIRSVRLLVRHQTTQRRSHIIFLDRQSYIAQEQSRNSFFSADARRRGAQRPRTRRNNYHNNKIGPTNISYYSHGFPRCRRFPVFPRCRRFRGGVGCRKNPQRKRGLLEARPKLAAAESAYRHEQAAGRRLGRRAREGEPLSLRTGDGPGFEGVGAGHRCRGPHAVQCSREEFQVRRLSSRTTPALNKFGFEFGEHRWYASCGGVSCGTM